MEEQAFRFGDAEHLVGIAGLPAGAGQAGVIIVNAGMVHRVGPFRLHVELARHLNACAYPTLRFDLSNLGDSGAGGRSLSRAQQVLADIEDAMDLLARHAGCSRFVVLGLCSGAVDAHRAALHLGPRVAGAIFIDGYIFRTPGFRLRHYLPRVFSARRLLGFLGRAASPAQPDETPVYTLDESRSKVRQDYFAMLARGQHLCFIYSGGMSDWINHERQFRECFGRRLAAHPGVSVRYFPQTDHTYALGCDRDLLINTITTWLQRAVPAEQSQGGGAAGARQCPP